MQVKIFFDKKLLSKQILWSLYGFLCMGRELVPWMAEDRLRAVQLDLNHSFDI